MKKDGVCRAVKNENEYQHMSTFFKMLFSSPSFSHIHFCIHLYNFVILNIKHELYCYQKSVFWFSSLLIALLILPRLTAVLVAEELWILQKWKARSFSDLRLIWFFLSLLWVIDTIELVYIFEFCRCIYFKNGRRTWDD